MWSTWPTPRATSSTFSDPDQGGAFGGWSLYDGGGLGKGGTVTLYVDGAKVGAGRRADGVLG